MQFIRDFLKDHQTGPMLGVGAAIGLTAVMIFHSAGANTGCPPSRCRVEGVTVTSSPAPLSPVDPEPSELESEGSTPDAATAPVASKPSTGHRSPSKSKAKTKPSPTPTPTTAPVAGDNGSGSNNDVPVTTTTTAPGLLSIPITLPGS